MDPVAVEEIGHMTDTRGFRSPPEVAASSRWSAKETHPSLVQPVCDDLQKGPDRPARGPGISAWLDSRTRRERFAYEGARKREIDIGANPVMAPALDPSRLESRWVSQRSIPRVGTATTSGVIGSGSAPRAERRACRRARQPAPRGVREARRQGTERSCHGVV